MLSLGHWSPRWLLSVSVWYPSALAVLGPARQCLVPQVTILARFFYGGRVGTQADPRHHLWNSFLIIYIIFMTMISDISDQCLFSWISVTLYDFNFCLSFLTFWLVIRIQFRLWYQFLCVTSEFHYSLRFKTCFPNKFIFLVFCYVFVF